MCGASLLKPFIIIQEMSLDFLTWCQNFPEAKRTTSKVQADFNSCLLSHLLISTEKYKGYEILFYLQGNKLVCYNFVETGRKY